MPGIEERTRPQGVGIGPRGVEGTRLQGVGRPMEKKEGTRPQGVEVERPPEKEKEGTAPQEGGIVLEQARPWEVGNVPEVQANLGAVGKVLGFQVQLGQLGRLEWRRVQQQEVGTGPRGVGIGRMEPQGVDTDQGVDIDQGVGIDPGAGNSLDKHKAEAAGSIGLEVGSTQVVLVVRHILLGVHSKVVGQAHRPGVGRVFDPLEAS